MKVNSVSGLLQSWFASPWIKPPDELNELETVESSVLVLHEKKNAKKPSKIKALLKVGSSRDIMDLGLIPYGTVT